MEIELGEVVLVKEAGGRGGFGRRCKDEVLG